MLLLIAGVVGSAHPGHAQPQRVADINPVSEATIGEGIHFDDGTGSAFYFVAEGINYGNRGVGATTYTSLFRFDGQSTEYVTNISTSTFEDPSDFSLAVYDDGSGARLCYGAQAGFDSALFCYDGSTTEAVETFDEEGQPQELTVFDGSLYFRATGDTGGSELYAYDGSTVTQVTDLNPSGDTTPQALTVYDDGTTPRLCFFGFTDTEYGFACTNGMSTSFLRAFTQWEENFFVGGTSFTISPEMVVYDSLLYLVGDDDSAGRELFVYDGTSVSLTEDMATGFYNDAFPSGLTVYDPGAGSKLYFLALTDDGYGLVRYNGSSTSLVQSFTTPYPENPSTALYDDGSGRQLYFSANDGTAGEEILAYDGTDVTVAADIQDGSSGSMPNHLRVQGNDAEARLLFTATSSERGRQWFSYDGTSATRRTAYSWSDNISDLNVVYDDGSGAMLYLVAAGELHQYDGTGIPTPAATNGSSLHPQAGLLPYDDGSGTKLYFAAEGDDGEELYSYDGSTITLVADIYTGTSGTSPRSSQPGDFVEHDGALYFTAENGSVGREVFRYDGSVSAVTNVNAGGDSDPVGPVVYDDGSGAKLYFLATDGTEDGLYRYDGSTTQQVGTVPDVRTNLVNADPVVYDGTLYFVAFDSNSGLELYQSDGTSISLVEDLAPGSDSAYPNNFTVYDDGSGAKLYFQANSDVVSQGLFAYDGTSISLVNGTDGLSPSDPTVYGSKLYFVGGNDEVGTELFRYDGTRIQSYDLFAEGSSRPSALTTYNPGSGEMLYFGANAGDFRGQTFYRYEQGTVFPVELAGFDALLDAGTVRLQWATASETDNAGFHVERAVEDGKFTRIGFVEGAGTTSEAQSYNFRDADWPSGAATLTYRLRQVDLDGAATLQSPITVRLNASAFTLEAPFPNPARTTATVRYTVPDRKQTSLLEMAVYDVLGRRLQTLIPDPVPGAHVQTVDVTGLPVGVYFLRMATGSTVHTQRFTVVR